MGFIISQRHPCLSTSCTTAIWRNCLYPEAWKCWLGSMGNSHQECSLGFAGNSWLENCPEAFLWKIPFESLSSYNYNFSYTFSIFFKTSFTIIWEHCSFLYSLESQIKNYWSNNISTTLFLIFFTIKTLFLFFKPNIF